MGSLAQPNGDHLLLNLRQPAKADWPDILKVADLSVPFDFNGNREWIHNRRTFDVDDSRPLTARARPLHQTQPPKPAIAGFALAEPLVDMQP